MQTLILEVILTLLETVSADKLPHLFQVHLCQPLVLVPGWLPLCLCYNQVGHVRRHYKTRRCSRCGCCGHTVDACVTTYATKLSDNLEREGEFNNKLIMDVTKVMVASREAPENCITLSAIEERAASTALVLDGMPPVEAQSDPVIH